MNKLNEILLFIEKKHRGQLDKNGELYILHPIYLAIKFNDDKLKQIALLHDILEDTDTAVKEILDLIESDDILDAIICLTKNKKESYQKYIERVSMNKMATLVKIEDLKHNMDLSRLSNVTTKDLNRNSRYNNALNYLKQSITIFYYLN